ncbi:hypothetical protein KGB38_gp09 [Salmonella phage vB_SenS_SB28]|uniref:Uncharacterized protein n=4 Tax=Caudoviricetes TaxID=2731619 RepID=A0A5J6TA23_9CAUD|nr:hypothetical protein KGB38_gp09 [Salmonella phage vB_SenS_SB28]QFG07750.1 hypothetical protein [Salmonella phage vB_SenS_SB28]
MKEFPWNYCANDPDWVTDSNDNIAVARVTRYNMDAEAQHANAKLIAASPALLSALQQLLEIYDDNSGKVWTTSSKRRALDNARAAVNKALGETK